MVRAAWPVHYPHSECMINVSGKEKHHDDDQCCVDEWLAVRRFDWALGHGVGMVAEE